MREKQKGEQVHADGVGDVKEKIGEVVTEGVLLPDDVVKAQGDPGERLIVPQPKGRERPADLLPAEAAVAPTTPTAVAAPEPAPAAPSGAGRVSPLARRLAREKGIDLAQVTGSGPNGRITEADVLAYEESLKAAAPPPTASAEAPAIGAPAAPGAVEIMELSRMRQAIARITSRSKQEAPHFYVTVEVDMTATVNLRRELNSALQAQGVRVSINDFIIKSCAVALKRHPTVNATFRQDALELHSAINIGLAIDLEERGLMIPTLFGCESRSLMEIAVASRDLAERAREDRLRAEELGGSTFSVSNMGMFEVDAFTAIIFQPNSAVLAVAAVRERPVVREGQVTVAQMMNMTLSVDHRVTDGAGAARFMRELKHILEHPVSLLV